VSSVLSLVRVQCAPPLCVSSVLFPVRVQCALSVCSSLKKELVHDADFATRAEAKAAIFEWIEVFYNRERLHSSLGYVSPEAFEAAGRSPSR